MKSSGCRWWIGAIAVILPLQPLAAQQETRVDTFTVEQVVSLALEHHPSIRGAQANVQAASAGVTQSMSALYPSLSASAGFTRNDGYFVFNPSIPARYQTYNNYTTGFSANYTIFDFGKTINRISASNRLENASESDYDAARQTVIMNAEVAYFGLIQAIQVQSANEEAVQQTTRHLAEAKAFYSAGRVAQLDVTTAEVNLANANVNLIHARNQVRITKLQLENAMGVYPTREYTVRETFDTIPFTLSLDSVRAITFSQRPEYVSAQSRLEANKSLLTAAWDQNLPTISATGGYTWSNFDVSPLFSRWTAGLTVSLPIFQGFSITGQVEQAQANVDAAQANLNLLNESIKLEVEQNYLSLREAQDRINATSKLVDQAEEALNLAVKQYNAGVGTQLEVTDAQLALTNARITRIQALHDYSTSRVQLLRSMGVLGK